MTLVDLNDGSVAPEGGEIVRDENGRAPGMMRESAQDVCRQAFSGHQGRRPAGVAEDEMRRMVLLAGDASLRHGITSFAEVDLLKRTF